MKMMKVRRLAIIVSVLLVTSCASKPGMQTDIDWRPQMLERSHTHTGTCCRYLPITRGEN